LSASTISHSPVDILGIGFGPANLAMAIALEEASPRLSVRFLEARHAPDWQPGMLLDGSDIQNHPSRDLVTLRNPRSRYSFLNYLFEEDRLLRYLNLPSPFPLRKEYAQYVRWAAGFFSHQVDFNQRASRIAVMEQDGEKLYQVVTASGEGYLARALVVAPGRSPYVPHPYDGFDSERVFHLNDYLPSIKRLTADRDPEAVAVIGGSQSAVELALDLTRRFPQARIALYTRSHSLRQKDHSPFSEEGYFPEFTNYYYQASRRGKRVLDAYMRPTNYSSSDADVLDALYMTIYEQELDGRQRVFVHGNQTAVGLSERGGRVTIDFEERHTGARMSDDVEFVVLATGFRNLGPGADEEMYPPLLAGIANRFALEEDGRLFVAADYSLAERTPGEMPPIFLNGLCESSHGIGDAGSFSLLSLRAATLTNALRARLASGQPGIAEATGVASVA
jgi:L-ornithine N5-oxygenase